MLVGRRRRRVGEGGHPRHPFRDRDVEARRGLSHHRTAHEDLEQVADTCEDVLGLLDHDTVVAGEIGLALDAVDDEGIDGLAVRDGQLRVGRQCRAPEADNARVLDRAEDVTGARGLPSARKPLDGLLCRAGKGLEEDAGHHPPGDAGHQLDVPDHTGSGCVERHRQKAVRSGDPLAPDDLLTLPHDRDGRLAGVLEHGMTSTGANGNWRIGRARVSSFNSGGWTP